MRVLSYNYIKPNDNGIVECLTRSDYMTPQYINLMKEYLSTIKLEGKCAVLYAGGVLLSASEARSVKDKGLYREVAYTSGIAIKELAAYSMHKWIGMLDGKENVKYANINGNTCASSMYSLYEASKLLEEDFDQVIIIAEEKTSYNTLRIFDEHKIDLKVGEGCAILCLGKGDGISNCKWNYEYNRNPFGVTTTGYKDIMSDCDYIKPHGTGTSNNEDAELVYGEIHQIRYKEKYGHTQGVSGLLEVCMVLDEDVVGDVLCISSGLGGYYGSCIIHM